jgi:hypothetical protein
MKHNELVRIYSRECPRQLQVGDCWTDLAQFSFTILFAPAEDLVGIDRVLSRQALRFLRRSGASLRAIAVVLLIWLTVSKGVCSEVSIYPFVDTCRCVHEAHHPYLHTLRPDGPGRTLTPIRQ